MYSVNIQHSFSPLSWSFSTTKWWIEMIEKENMKTKQKAKENYIFHIINVCSAKLNSRKKKSIKKDDDASWNCMIIYELLIVDKHLVRHKLVTELMILFYILYYYDYIFSYFHNLKQSIILYWIKWMLYFRIKQKQK